MTLSPIAGELLCTASLGHSSHQGKRKSTKQLFQHQTGNEKMVKLDDESNEDQPPPTLTRKLTPMSDLLDSLLETEHTRKDHNKKAVEELFSPPPLKRKLTPMSDLLDTSLDTPSAPEKEDLVYFPVEVDLERLRDWKEALSSDQEQHSRIEQESLQKGAVVNVNNTDVAVFKYGDSLLATNEKCPHAGGPLHLGDIEMLPDRSLCVRCPWHKWTFCISSGTNNEVSKSGNNMNSRVGSCTYPLSRPDKRLKVFPVVMENNRKHIKIGFESITKETLMEEKF